MYTWMQTFCTIAIGCKRQAASCLIYFCCFYSLFWLNVALFCFVIVSDNITDKKLNRIWFTSRIAIHNNNKQNKRRRYEIYCVCCFILRSTWLLSCICQPLDSPYNERRNNTRAPNKARAKYLLEKETGSNAKGLCFSMRCSFISAQHCSALL